MKTNKKTFISLAIFVLIFVLDFFSKKASMSVGGALPVIAQGASQLDATQGLAESPSATMQVIHYATFLGPLMLIYFFLLSQMAKKQLYRHFQPWVTFWVFGLVGTIVDRMLYGGVVRWGEVGGVSLSLATLSIFIGLLGCLIQIVRHRKLVFQFYTQRRMTMTHPRFQSFFIGKIIAVSMFLALSLLVFSFTFLKYYVFQFGILIPKPLVNIFVLEFFLITAVFFGILMVMGLFYSSKIAGPLYAFEKYIEKLKQGEDATFTLREDDDFKELEDIAKDIKNNWNRSESSLSR